MIHRKNINNEFKIRDKKRFVLIILKFKYIVDVK